MLTKFIGKAKFGIDGWVCSGVGFVGSIICSCLSGLNFLLQNANNILGATIISGYSMTTYQDKNRAEWMRFLESIMDMSCALCGYNRCMNALVFHHIKPSKDNVSVGKLIATQTPTEKSKDKVLNEIKKCVLLCSNCRKEVIAGDREIIET